MMDRFINFDGLSFPLEGEVVTIDTDDPRIEGVGITWGEIEGCLAITVEVKLRGYEPMHVSLTQDDSGAFRLMLPEMYIAQQEENA